MKIVHICLTGIFADGFSYQENLLSKYHRKLNYQIDLITSKWTLNKYGNFVKDTRKTYTNNDGVNIIRLELIGRDSFRKKIKIYKNFYQELEKSNPNIIFIHGPQFLQMSQIKKYLKTHSCVSLYIDNHADFSNSAKNFFSKLILHKLIWRYCAKCVLKYTKKYFGVLPARVDFLTKIYKIPEKKVDLLIMGADDEEVENINKNKNIIKNELKIKYDINSDDFLIVTGGKIDKYKIETLTLMKLIKKYDKKNIKLLIFGSIADEIKDKFNSLLDNNIRYIGWLNSKESYILFGCADLVVFPGRHSVYWEQVVALGVPMLCKYWKGTTHIDIGGNVIFTNPDNEEIFFRDISKCLNEDIYIKMKICANKEMKKNFLYSNIAKKSIEIE